MTDEQMKDSKDKSIQDIRLNGIIIFFTGIIIANIAFLMHYEDELKMWAVLLLVPMFVCLGAGTILIISPKQIGEENDGGSIEIHNH